MTTSFSDESGQLFVGRFLLPEEIRPWIMAQSFGAKPAIYAVTHHTYRPTADQWRGRESLDGVFRYYRDNLGWPEGKGPHFWVATESGPGSPLGLWIGTHPRHDGIHVAGWNHRSLGMEYVWNGDLAPFTDEMLRVGAITWQAIEEKIGIPIRLTTDESPGHFFHRDYASKSCPGNKNTHSRVMTAYRELDQEEQDMTDEQAAQLTEALTHLNKLRESAAASSHRETETVELLKEISAKLDNLATVDAGEIVDEFLARLK